MSPTFLSLNRLREQGYLVDILENWNPFAQVRQDAFGIIDILAVGNGQIVAVQTTTSTNISAHKKKILAHDDFLRCWLAAGGLFELHGWEKKRATPKGRLLWTVRVFFVDEQGSLFWEEQS